MASIRQRDGQYRARVSRKGHQALSKSFTNRGDAMKQVWTKEV